MADPDPLLRAALLALAGPDATPLEVASLVAAVGELAPRLKRAQREGYGEIRIVVKAGKLKSVGLTLTDLTTVGPEE